MSFFPPLSPLPFSHRFSWYTCTQELMECCRRRNGHLKRGKPLQIVLTAPMVIDFSFISSTCLEPVRGFPKTAGSVVIIPQACVKCLKLTIKKQQFLNGGSTVCVSGCEFRLGSGKGEE